ncbi:T-complex protein 11-domain-containing protein [Coniella lustricola]|uniref:T-complex protein 11-domain-containing protein n=1 Tax=Coniella lustricola TaxID=2025994 RepID=A0A2T2ZTE6_9PEZI|nr:T-complex protein 11-domain-containing protein [Coniella lustricola]
MNDQGAAGGHITHPQHTRSESQNEAAPAERLVETRTTATTELDEQLQHPRSESDGRPAPNAAITPASPSSGAASQAAIIPPRQIALSTSPEPRNPIPYLPRPLEPPVTKATLSELDVTKIIHNPKLRHDINFDPELHFRPNLDGEKGRRKQEKANQFWTSLRNDLILCVVDKPAFQRQHPNGEDWCLPILLKAVKEIIQTLVPQRDRDFLHEGFNIELLMQQFDRGVADLEKVASWLSGVLKLHCAPMRDEWVDEMYNELSNGNKNNDMDELVKGMRSLLSVLEAMKLDVANHQIRCLRPMLIEDTVHFEQRFFFKKIQNNRLDISAARAWYSEAVQSYEGKSHHSRLFGGTAPFFEAVSKLILPSTSKEAIPNTFVFDEERIVKLRSDMLDAINLEVCMRLYDDLERVSRVHSMAPSFAAPTSVPAYVMDDDTPPQSNRNSGDFSFLNATSSRPSSLALSSYSSTASSPRSSGYIAFPSTTSSDTLESNATKANTVYDSLVALLNTAPQNQRPHQRWQGLVPSIAIQIFRYTNAPQDFLPQFETKLAQHLAEMKSDLYQAVEAHFQSKMMVELGRRVKDFKELSGVALFSTATGGRVPGATSTRPWDDSEMEDVKSGPDAREDNTIDDMAIRLAHLGLLHWRVWSEMAYLDRMDEMEIE